MTSITPPLSTPISTNSARTGGFNWWPILTSAIMVISWSGAYPGVRIALQGYSPSQIAFLRYLIASLIFLIYALITRMPFPARRDWPGIAGLGILGFAVYSLMLNIGEQTVSAGVTSLIIASEVATIALLARIFLKERLKRLGWIGVGLCFAGSASLSIGSSADFRLSAGALLLISAMIAISLYTIGLRRYTGRYNGIHLTAWMMWAATPILFLTAPDSLTAITAAPISSTAAIIFLGVFTSVIGYTLWTLLIKRITIAQAGSLTTLVPIGSVILGVLLLNEQPAPIALIGGAVILIGVVLVNRQ